MPNESKRRRTPLALAATNGASAARVRPMMLLGWFGVIILMAIGLLGTVLPIMPGTTIIFGAALGHRLLVGAEAGMSWWGLAGLAALTLLSYALDFASSYLGAKRFGATRWGLVGAIIGGIIGIFTGLITLLVLPIAGAIVGEIVGGKALWQAGKAGWGTLLGTVFGMVGKLALGLIMVSWWLLAVPPPAPFR